MSKMDVKSFVLMNSANIYIQGEQAVACCEGAKGPKGVCWHQKMSIAMPTVHVSLAVANDTINPN